MFRLPLTYVPRYLFGNGSNPREEKKTDKSYNQASVDGGKQTGWNVVVNVNKSAVVGYLTEVVSHTHPIKVVDGEETTKVELDFDNLDADKVAQADF